MATSRTPTTTELIEVLVRLHDDVRQSQYPYSSKISKYNIIGEAEMSEAGPDASEADIWRGQKASEVELKLAGALTKYVESEGYHEKWVGLGIAEGSWKEFLKIFCNLKAVDTPIQRDDYCRVDEADNLLVLIRALDSEVFSHPDMQGMGNLKACLKSKWWKECHRVFAESVCEEVYRGMGLQSRPKDAPCYSKRWESSVEGKVRELATRWRECALWDQASDVDFTVNNERVVKAALEDHGFTAKYLEGR